MLIRIVKMHFREDYIGEFLENFDAIKEKIRHYPGCLHLELLRDQNDQAQFFTYSHWDEPGSLEGYRKSKLFRSVWAKTKTGFNKPPEAWSINRIESLP